MFINLINNSKEIDKTLQEEQRRRDKIELEDFNVMTEEDLDKVARFAKLKGMTYGEFVAREHEKIEKLHNIGKWKKKRVQSENVKKTDSSGYSITEQLLLERIMELRKKGMTYACIADFLNISKSKAYNLYKRAEEEQE